MRLHIDSLHSLRADLLESLRAAFTATGHRIISAEGEDETERKIAEVANNLAGGLLAYVDEESEAA